MNFLQKLDFLMKRYNLNRRTLSQHSDIPYTTIDGWYKKGYEGLKLTTLRKIASFFNTSIEYWVNDDIDDPNYDKSTGFKVDFQEMTHIKKYRTLDEYGKGTVNLILDREYLRCTAPIKEAVEEDGEIIELSEYLTPVSAGRGILLDEDVDSETIKVRSNLYTRKADYCLTVRGNSMEPKFFDGDKLLVQKVDDVDFGEIGIFIVDGQGYVKKKGEHCLISLNESIPDVYVGPYDTYHCVGLVVGTLDPDWLK